MSQYKINLFHSIALGFYSSIINGLLSCLAHPNVSFYFANFCFQLDNSLLFPSKKVYCSEEFANLKSANAFIKFP